MRGLSFYQWDDEPTKNLGSGTRRYFGLADRPAVQQRHAQAGALDDAGAVRDRSGQGLASGLLWGQVRAGRAGGDHDPGQAARRGRVPRPRARSHTAADGTWSRRITLTSGAAYRYRWTPKPNALDPAPFPRFSGIVDLGKTEKSRYKASLAF